MVGESNQNVFLNQKDALNFIEFDISEFEISRFDCSYLYHQRYISGQPLAGVLDWDQGY